MYKKNSSFNYYLMIKQSIKVFGISLLIIGCNNTDRNKQVGKDANQKPKEEEKKIEKEITKLEEGHGGIIVYENIYGYGIAATPDLGYKSWKKAKETCNNLNLNGFDDWRLPSSVEFVLFYKNLPKCGYSKASYWCSEELHGGGYAAAGSWSYEKDSVIKFSNQGPNSPYPQHFFAVRSY